MGNLGIVPAGCGRASRRREPVSATHACEKDGSGRRLMERLESLRQALGADRLGLARRPPVLESPPFESLGRHTPIFRHPRVGGDP